MFNFPGDRQDAEIVFTTSVRIHVCRQEFVHNCARAGVSGKMQSGPSCAVVLCSKSEQTSLGYFDPIKIMFDSKNE